MKTDQWDGVAPECRGHASLENCPTCSRALKTVTFSIPAARVRVLGDIAKACDEAAKVSVVYLDSRDHEPQEVSGVARHVVEPDSCAFAREWTSESCLRVTATFDHFIPLGDILEIREAV